MKQTTFIWTLDSRNIKRNWIKQCYKCKGVKMSRCKEFWKYQTSYDHTPARCVKLLAVIPVHLNLDVSDKSKLSRNVSRKHEGLLQTLVIFVTQKSSFCSQRPCLTKGLWLTQEVILTRHTISSWFQGYLPLQIGHLCLWVSNMNKSGIYHPCHVLFN